MKKIISRYYFFIAILLVIADQFLIRLLLYSDLAAGLSDFSYYLSDMLLNFLVVLSFYSFLALLAFVIWNFVIFYLFPPTKNEIAYQLAIPTFTGATAFLMYFFYPVIAGPIFEEIIYRGLVMTALEKGKKWGLDVLGSAALFGILHISNHGWVFLIYGWWSHICSLV